MYLKMPSPIHSSLRGTVCLHGQLLDSSASSTKRMKPAAFPSRYGRAAAPPTMSERAPEGNELARSALHESRACGDDLTDSWPAVSS